MARPGAQTFAKRQREQLKREKRRAKRDKMALRRAMKQQNAEADGSSTVGEAEQLETDSEVGRPDATNVES